jgi:hypothetical protein
MAAALDGRLTDGLAEYAPGAVWVGELLISRRDHERWIGGPGEHAGKLRLDPRSYHPKSPSDLTRADAETILNVHPREFLGLWRLQAAEGDHFGAQRYPMQGVRRLGCEWICSREIAARLGMHGSIKAWMERFGYGSPTAGSFWRRDALNDLQGLETPGRAWGHWYGTVMASLEGLNPALMGNCNNVGTSKAGG